ncbi:MAG TPA: hypothetical protein DCY02_05270 [Armatimonadetes bacterium]|nr:hypothetical protein [Armatimonadota bacterium]HCM73524.1 hypothetical protein [Armatimonadota bacterium]
MVPRAGNRRQLVASYGPDDMSVIERLSKRELEIVRLAGEGYTDKKISAHLEIAPGTLNTYWMRIRAKVGRHTRAEIVRLYTEHTLAQRMPAAAVSTDARQETESLKNYARALEACLSGASEEWFVADTTGRIIRGNLARSINQIPEPEWEDIIRRLNGNEAVWQPSASGLPWLITRTGTSPFIVGARVARVGVTA